MSGNEQKLLHKADLLNDINENMNEYVSNMFTYTVFNSKQDRRHCSTKYC